MSLTYSCIIHLNSVVFSSLLFTHFLFQCHAAIRKDPSPKAKVDKKVAKKRWNAAKIGLVARQAKVAKTKAEFLAQIEEQKE